AAGGGTRGEPDGCDHRQPERQGRSKRGSVLDPQGFDAGKKVTGRKRHILVDTLGLLLNVVVHPADVQDRVGAYGQVRSYLLDRLWGTPKHRRRWVFLTARREHIEDRVQNFADVHLSPTPTTLRRRYPRFDQRPLAVAQITRIAQAMAVGGTAVFRLPHSAPLSSDAGAREGITTDSSDSTTL